MTRLRSPRVVASRLVLAAVVTLAALVGPAVAYADPPLEARIARYRAELSRAPGAVGPRVRLIELLVTEGRSRDALVELDVLEALSPGEPVADRLRARALMAAGRDADAVALLDESLAEREDPEARWLRGALLERSGRLEEALADYEAVALAQPGVERSAALGRVYRGLGRIVEARDALELGVERHGGAVILRRALIELELEEGDPSRALPHLEALIAAARVATRWRVLRAEALTRMGQEAAASAELGRALADSERLLARRGSALALLERGRVYLAMGRLDDALRDVEQARRRAPRSLEGARLLAQVRAAQRAGAGR